jgi:hypothetical protein
LLQILDLTSAKTQLITSVLGRVNLMVLPSHSAHQFIAAADAVAAVTVAAAVMIAGNCTDRPA